MNKIGEWKIKMDDKICDVTGELYQWFERGKRGVLSPDTRYPL